MKRKRRLRKLVGSKTWYKKKKHRNGQEKIGGKKRKEELERRNASASALSGLSRYQDSLLFTKLSETFSPLGISVFDKSSFVLE